MTIHPEFSLGQKVYLVTDPEQYARIITKYIVNTNGIEYEVALGLSTMVCQACELATTKNVVDYM